MASSCAAAAAHLAQAATVADVLPALNLRRRRLN
jgi:hypothetical protein